jgi:hypothetical protein
MNCSNRCSRPRFSLYYLQMHCNFFIPSCLSDLHLLKVGGTFTSDFILLLTSLKAIYSWKREKSPVDVSPVGISRSSGWATIKVKTVRPTITIYHRFIRAFRLERETIIRFLRIDQNLRYGSLRHRT